MESIIKWQTGTPNEVGTYIITTIDGEIDFDEWEHIRGWGIYLTKAVIAWCPIGNIKPFTKDLN